MIGNILDGKVVIGHMLRATKRTVVHPSLTKALFSALLNNNGLTAPMETFVSNYVRKNSNRVKKEENLVGLRKMIRELPLSAPASYPSDDDDIKFKKKKNDTYVMIRRPKRN